MSTLPDTLHIPIPLVASATVPNKSPSTSLTPSQSTNNNYRKAQSFRHPIGQKVTMMNKIKDNNNHRPGKKNHDQQNSNNNNNNKLWIIRASKSSSSQEEQPLLKINEDNRDDNDANHNELLLEQNLTPAEKNHRRMARFHTQVLQSVHNVYDMDKMLRQVSANGSLTTSLPQDIISMMYTFSSVLKDCFIHDQADSSTQPNFKDETSENMHQWFIDGMSFVLKAIRETHQQTRSILITSSVEDCCAASNDYFRLSELLEPFYEESLLDEFPFVTKSARGLALKQEFDDLGSIMIQDAVAAAEYCQHFVMSTISHQSTLKSDLFSVRWEDEWTCNQPAHELIQILDEHINLTEQYMCASPYLFNKSIVATVKAVVCFYIRCLVCKADALDHQQRVHHQRMGMFVGNDNNEAPFQNNQRALLRMRGDISIISSFFTDRINQGGHLNQADKNSTTVLSRIVSNELWILKVIHECLESTWVEKDKDSSSGDNDSSSLQGFAVVLHKKTGANALVTKFLMSDLWLLSDCQMNKRDEIRRIVNELQDDLQLVTTNMTDQNQPKGDARNALSPLRRRASKRTVNEGLSLATTIRVDDMLRGMYEDRVAQGILPLCWLWLPKEISDATGGDDDEDDSSNDIDKVIAAKIHKFTRDVVQLPKHVIGLTQKSIRKHRRETTNRNIDTHNNIDQSNNNNDIHYNVITDNIQKFTRDVVQFPKNVVEFTQKNINHK